jgi:hypothetical protein
MLIRTIDNFLSDEECNHIIKLINETNYPSTVVGGDTGYTKTEQRTSFTSALCDCDNLVYGVKEKVSDLLKVSVKQIETLQGQLYKPGQYFRKHYDYFEGDEGSLHIGNMGNRLWTCMVYLNDDLEGGQTRFPNIDLEFTPKKGMAVLWQNINKKGEMETDSLHEGCDVISGTKYIITAWVRENEMSSNTENQLVRMDSQIPFKDYTELPKLTENGFIVKKIPEDIWNFIKGMYDDVKDNSREENFDGKDLIIPNEINKNSSDIFSLDLIWEKRNILHQLLLDMHKEWCGEDIEPTFIYGIRSYNYGSKLALHRDRVETHHISSIICVDKNLNGNSDWGLDIQTHNGEWQKVFIQPGEILLYESAVCDHGRNDMFEGEYYRNMFIHYKLKNYIFQR